MDYSSDKSAPPSYTSCFPDNVAETARGFEQFVQIVGNHSTLHFHSPNGMGLVPVPQAVQIRDSTEKPILSVIVGRNIVSAGRNRALIYREIISPNGEALITISSGNV